VGPCPSEKPEHWGITLHTHKVVWERVASLIARDPGRYFTHEADRLLRQAERDTHINLGDEEVRSALLEKVHASLGIGIIRRCYIEALLSADIPVTLYGDGWQHLSESAPCTCRPLPHGADQLNALYNAAQIVPYIYPSGWIGPDLLNPVAAGAFVLVRAHPRDRRSDGLGAILKPNEEIITFRDPPELVRQVQHFLHHPEKRQEIAQRGRQKLLEAHSYRQRLPELLARLAK